MLYCGTYYLNPSRITMKKLLCICAIAFLVPYAASDASSRKTSYGMDVSKTDYLNSIKITFLSWFSGSTKVAYERAFPNLRQSAEFCTSLISAGYDKYHNDPLGYTLRYAHKFFTSDREQPSLMGFYLRPEIMFSRYYYDKKSADGRTLASMGAILGTMGYQYVYKRFLADFWVGAGYAVGVPAETNYHHGFELWHWFGRENKNLAMSFSIRLGVCF